MNSYALYRMALFPITLNDLKGRGQVTQTIEILVATNHIVGTTEARVVKFYTQV